MSIRPTAQDLSILAKVPLLSELPQDKRAAIIATTTVVQTAKRQQLFAEGDVAAECYFVIDGWVRLFRTTRSGAQADIGIFGPGQSFAEAVMFLGGVFPASAEAVEPARLARLPLAEMRYLLARDTDLAMALLGSLSIHLHRLVTRVSSDRLRSAEERVCEYLLRQSPPEPASCVVHLPYDKTVLAGQLGMAPEALSRAFASLRALGVHVDGRDVVIANREAIVRRLE